MIDSKLVCLALAVAAITPLLAQNDPGPTPLPAPKPTVVTKEMEDEMNRNFDAPSPDTLPFPDDPNLSKIGFLRIWYLGGPGSPRVSLALEDEKRKNSPFLVETGLTAGNVIASYFPMALGSYKLHILDGGVFRPTSPSEPLPLEEKKLQPAVTFELNPGVYTTLILTVEGGEIKVETVDQKPLDKEAVAELRVLNFSTLDGWSIRLRDANGNEKEVWSPSAGSGVLLGALPRKGRFELPIYVSKEGVTRIVDVLPYSPLAGQKRSIVLHDGLGGWGGFQTVIDAHPGSSYDATYIKSLTQSPP